MLRTSLLGCSLLLVVSGCGTTNWSDTKRTATEQLLISDAIDRAVSGVDFGVLRGERIYLDRQYLKGTQDEEYLVSTLRQHMLGSGCVLIEQRDEANYVVEARAGAVGTVRHDVLYGVPATDIGWASPMAAVPSRIPEIPLARKTDQQGVAKIGVFAYHRETGMPVWQSGISQHASKAQDLWVLGVGPFEHGSIYSQGRFVGDVQIDSFGKDETDGAPPIWVAEPYQFQTPRQLATRLENKKRAEAERQAVEVAAKPEDNADAKK